MSKLPSKFKETIIHLAKILKDTQYAFRGTTSLVLQGIDMNVDDIDILCDKKTALACNKLLKDYLVEKVKHKKSEKFKSYYGRFEINNIQIEIMGEWKIKNKKGEWSKPFNASKDEITIIKIDDKKIKVTKVGTELRMFVQMERWNAYHKIKRQLNNRTLQVQQPSLL